MGKSLGFRVALAVSSLWIVCLLGNGIEIVERAYAQEGFAENLTLINTYIKTGDTNVHFSTGATPVFSSTMIACPPPRTRSCTIRIQLSAQFENIEKPNIAGAVITVDNSEDGVLPAPVLGLATATTPFGASTARTFTWMKRDLRSGNHSIDVYFFVTGGEADSPNRTLTIDVYRGPPGRR